MKLRVLAAACFTGLLASPVMAADVSHYICRSGHVEKVENSKELHIYAFIENGLAIGQIEKEPFHAMNSRCVGLVERRKLEKGANIGNGYCKYADKDGDGTVLSWKFKGKDRTWQFISGTGKWQGISGSGFYSVPVRSKSMFPGTFQNCVHVSGSYKLAP